MHTTLATLHATQSPLFGPMAVLRAEAGAPVHSFGPLTLFLLEQGVTCRPGFGVSPHDRVLRLSGYKSNERLITLLKGEFPRWLEAHPEFRPPQHPELVIPDALTPSPILPPELDYPTQGLIGDLRKFLAPRAGQLAGLGYLAGNLNLLFAAGSPSQKGIDLPRALTSLTYMSSSLILALNAGQPDAQALDAIVEEAIAKAPEPHRAWLSEHRVGVRAVADKLVHIVQNHPWEATALTNGAATLSFLGGHLINQRWAAAGGSALALASCALQALPPEGRPGLFNPAPLWERFEKTPLGQQVTEGAAREGSFLQQVGQMAQGVYSFLQQHRMPLSGVLNSISSVGYLISGLVSKDHGLFRTSLFYLFANTMQGLSSQRPSHTLGDAATVLADQLPGDVSELDALRLARRLHDAPDIAHDVPHLLQVAEQAQKMADREAQKWLAEQPDAFVREFSNTEKRAQALSQHPFLPAAQAGISARLG